MREITVFLIVLLHFNINASVYDFVNGKIDFSLPFLGNEIQKMHIKINGNNMQVSLIESNKSSEEVLALIYKEAEKRNCLFYNNETIFLIANLLYEIAGKNKYEDEFGYILYSEKNKKVNFFITAGDGDRSEIIKISSVINNKTKNFNDGIEHINDAQLTLSFEILSDFNTTLYFANFYVTTLSDRYELRNFYNYSLKKSGYKIIKRFYDARTDIFILTKKNKNYVFAISEERDENWIMVMG